MVLQNLCFIEGLFTKREGYPSMGDYLCTLLFPRLVFVVFTRQLGLPWQADY